MAHKTQYRIMYGSPDECRSGYLLNSLPEVFEAIEMALQDTRPFEIREERILMVWEPRRTENINDPRH